MPVQRSPSTSTRGIVHAAAGKDKFSLDRFQPGPELRPFVEHYWCVRYHVASGESYTQTVLSFPCVHLAFEEDDAGRRALVYGIPRRPFVRELRGAGRVLGVRFRAEGFFPFWRKDVALPTGRTVAAAEVFGGQAERWMHAVLDADYPAAMADAAEAALAKRAPEPDARADWVSRIVDEVMHDRNVIRVEQLSQRAGVSARHLQRLFHRYVGVTPKWVIKPSAYVAKSAPGVS